MVNHFGPRIAAELRKGRAKPHTTWHLDEVYLKIDGRLVYLRRAVDAEGEVLDVLVQTRLAWPIHYLFFSITCDRIDSFFRLGLAVSVR
jgi:transposase-like protein